MKKVLHLLVNRLFLTILAIVIQILFFVFVIWKLSNNFIPVYVGFIVLSVVMTIYIVLKDESPSFKLPWVILVLIMPLLGGILYLFFGHHHLSKKQINSWKKTSKKIKNLEIDNSPLKELCESDNEYAPQAKYICKYGPSALYKNTKTEYFTLGDYVFPKMIEDLKNAKEFIFIEYFIIKEGYFWNTILDVLKEKAAANIDVRVMYDDLGSIGYVPSRYYKDLEKMGIKCIPFNRFVPILSIIHNNRDHRKIMVIDGKIGYTGGINLSDEYINKIELFGHWKDTALRLVGQAVNELTILFLSNWNSYSEEINFNKYLKDNTKIKSDGLVIPYGDNPLDDEELGKNVYLNIIDQAKTYLYIMTPYLIVDFDLTESLCRAAKRGVDVEIILPGIPDKWYVNLLTKSSYDILISSGIKIYEYVKGFVHAKSFISDDVIGVTGTINLDYRSLVHHFENAVWMYKTSSLVTMKEDFIDTRTKSKLIKKGYANNIPWYKKIVRGFLKFFSPLM